jgi:hypothetical protein
VTVRDLSSELGMRQLDVAKALVAIDRARTETSAAAASSTRTRGSVVELRREDGAPSPRTRSLDSQRSGGDLERHTSHRAHRRRLVAKDDDSLSDKN